MGKTRFQTPHLMFLTRSRITRSHRAAALVMVIDPVAVKKALRRGLSAISLHRRKLGKASEGNRTLGTSLGTSPSRDISAICIFICLSGNDLLIYPIYVYFKMVSEVVSTNDFEALLGGCTFLLGTQTPDRPHPTPPTYHGYEIQAREFRPMQWAIQAFAPLISSTVPSTAIRGNPLVIRPRLRIIHLRAPRDCTRPAKIARAQQQPRVFGAHQS